MMERGKDDFLLNLQFIFKTLLEKGLINEAEYLRALECASKKVA